MRTLPTLLLATLVMLTAGCRSAPNNYHTLVAAQPSPAPVRKSWSNGSACRRRWTARNW